MSTVLFDRLPELNCSLRFRLPNTSSDPYVVSKKVNQEYVLIVQDQGIGIPEPDQSRLFSAFQRGINTQDTASTGLGLAIVRKAVDLLGGSIQLYSQVGKGMTITIRFHVH